MLTAYFFSVSTGEDSVSSGQRPRGPIKQTTMITRSRGHTVNNSKVQSLEVEVVDAVETVEDLTSPSEGFPIDDIDTAGIELDDLFGIEDLKWTLERDATSPLFNMELTDLGVYSTKCQATGIEASTASSPVIFSSLSTFSALPKKSLQTSHSGWAAETAERAKANRPNSFILNSKSGHLRSNNNNNIME